MNGLQPTVKLNGFSLIVWGAIRHDGMSELVVCEGGINSAKYMQILKEALLPIFGSLWCSLSNRQIQDVPHMFNWVHILAIP